MHFGRQVSDKRAGGRSVRHSVNSPVARNVPTSVEMWKQQTWEQLQVRLLMLLLLLMMLLVIMMGQDVGEVAYISHGGPQCFDLADTSVGRRTAATSHEGRRYAVTQPVESFVDTPRAAHTAQSNRSRSVDF